MSESICKFIPTKKEGGAVKTVRFVYETEYRTLEMPLLYPIYFIGIVTRGNASLSVFEKEYPLSVGDVFFIPPATAFSFDGSADFAYVYITFMGTEIPLRLSQMGVCAETVLYPSHPELLPIFENAIRRLTPNNANSLTEGVLFYALSFLSEKTEDDEAHTVTAFDEILGYVDRHFTDRTLSLSRLAQLFSYTEKYLSVLFKKRMQIGFNEYLNRLRIQHAHVLIETDYGSIAEIAYACGYSDPSYFSRIYKKKTGLSPSRMLSLLDINRKQARTAKEEKECDS